MTIQPTVGGVAQRAYDPLGPLTRHDPAAGWILLALVSALVASDEEPGQLLEDPGLAAYLHVDAAPSSWLPLLAAIVGARLTLAMDDTGRRDEIRTPTGHRRGLPASVLETARRFLDEPKRCILRERTDPLNAGDQPAHVTLQVRDSDLPDGQEAALTAAFLASLPVGLIGHVVVTDNNTYDDVEAAYVDYTAVTVAVTDYDDLLTPEA